ncbi:hypothetical protein [Lacticaseibacillus kribbianus]|uniref:hypothetical protein n=1 Tax=Lacticaseibacillus kribbianus TaxID=2926292 RepID=UPI001CD276C7|nr:hypothetical protein [Lacticaseibacillus kribbianus]
MEIDNNHLMTRYYDLQAKNAKVFKAVEAYVNQQVEATYTLLKDHFVDTITIDLEQAMQVAKDAGLAIDPAEAEIAVKNFILKDLDSIGLWILPAAQCDPNTIVAHLNFFNRSRYY